MDPTNNILSDIRERMVRVETKIDTFTDADKTANEALASTKSAHRRLDKVDKIIFWAGTTIVGAVVIAMIAMVLKGGA